MSYLLGWFWPPRRREIHRRIEERCSIVLEALGDGRLHYLQGDLDGLTGIPIYDLYVPLARLEQSGRVRSGWDDSTPWRRWYQVASSAR